MASLLEVYAALFPERDHSKPFVRAPLLPADVFAYTAHLLERSGAYHHIAPDVGTSSSGRYRELLVGARLRNRAIRVGSAWRRSRPALGRRLPLPPRRVEILWRSLRRHSDHHVFEPIDDDTSAPEWWIICLELMMIADEASQDIGFSADDTFARPVKFGYAEADLDTGREFRRIQRAPFSISTAAEDLVCVQAKSRTPSVGCTLRSLSHHLALLPPRGQVRARWVQPPFSPTPSVADNQLGLLLIPFPYHIDDDSFVSLGEDPRSKWGWFAARPTWLPNDSDRTRRRQFVAFVGDLIKQARSQGQRINGVVLPELSLNFAQFKSLARALVKDVRIDFLISGTCADQTHRHGNFVAIAPYFLLGRERRGNVTGWERTILVREKHHRWKLDPTQIAAYNLDLCRDRHWWEGLNILSRSLDILVYRGNTTLTTLICEDLARVDPCQAVVRAIGPNLLIALLMDGPQLTTRWPSRYATVLADDPGTSVLSLTSFGLIARQNDVGSFPQACAIGLWKDEIGGAKIIELPRGSDAIALQLKSVGKTEHTLDGRSDDNSSHRWEYESHRAITASRPHRPSWIVAGLSSRRHQ